LSGNCALKSRARARDFFVIFYLERTLIEPAEIRSTVERIAFGDFPASIEITRFCYDPHPIH
jgi:hypothetical protein